ncbi:MULTISPECIES: RadC family protein [unclassified Shewanella]|uniref:RadC family protein n=1 Tax=Shewanella TaxID=22 RepID=UPI0021DA8E74|nr:MULTISPECIES: DNA repair protein RadC [unclassified Shewanella]MCU8023935.1 DNA repair protein RadC [Shewanella sp. SM78]MCU8045098.1 DNA repair protein RadC [Shewanella sp. SM68]MCU8049384.1 DNA repair protein RadC [Shewanella sp. SM65]MCU8081004.1 DNA repair protein RadC [Shewanella sp. SM103]
MSTKAIHTKAALHETTDKHVTQWPQTADEVLASAANIIAERYVKKDAYTNPQATKDFLTYKLGGYEREVFAVILLDCQHQLLEFKELFFGTLDAASVYPREVVKAVLAVNAAAVIFAHNHPSGESEPSTADKNITKRLTDALALIDVRVLDHIVVGRLPVSFAERGLL